MFLSAYKTGTDPVSLRRVLVMVTDTPDIALEEMGLVADFAVVGQAMKPFYGLRLPAIILACDPDNEQKLVRAFPPKKITEDSNWSIRYLW